MFNRNRNTSTIIMWMKCMYIVGCTSCKCHPFACNPFCFQSAKPGCIRCQCIIHMLLELFRRTAKRGTCISPQKNIHASRTHSQHTYTSTDYNAMLFSTCKSTTLEGCVQYYSMSVLTLPFSFTFVSMTITAGRTSQIICQKSETVSGVGPAGGHTLL